MPCCHVYNTCYPQSLLSPLSPLSLLLFRRLSICCHPGIVGKRPPTAFGSQVSSKFVVIRGILLLVRTSLHSRCADISSSTAPFVIILILPPPGSSLSPVSYSPSFALISPSVLCSSPPLSMTSASLHFYLSLFGRRRYFFRSEAKFTFCHRRTYSRDLPF